MGGKQEERNGRKSGGERMVREMGEWGGGWRMGDSGGERMEREMGGSGGERMGRRMKVERDSRGEEDKGMGEWGGGWGIVREMEE